MVEGLQVRGVAGLVGTGPDIHENVLRMRLTAMFLSWIYRILARRKKPKGPGLKSDDPDIRDRPFAELWEQAPVPAKAYVGHKLPVVADQGSMGTCVPCALVAATSSLLYDSNNEFGKDETSLYEPFSRLFLYYEGRRLEGDTDVDSGMSVRNGLKALRNHGVCPEGAWPYLERRWAWKPDRRAYELAKYRKIRGYWRLRSLGEVRACLSSGHPVVAGLTLYGSSWKSAEDVGTMGLPELSEGPIGGHAVLIVGYDDSKGTVTCRNSMGMDWGKVGHFEMEYACFETEGIVRDMWTAR